MAELKPVPKYNDPILEELKPTEEIKEIPQHEEKEKETPIVGKPENTVVIGDKTIEIKPTKLKYQRDRTAAFYMILQRAPLTEILAVKDGMLDKERSSDKMLFDWLIAATDDPKLITDNYNSMTTETIYKILEIFCRVNYINVDEDFSLKKVLAQMMTVV